MAEESAKTPADHLADTLSQLKEMRHYSKTNVEHLTASWILFDGELKSLGQTAKVEELMNRQAAFHDALEKTIVELEGQLEEMTAGPENYGQR
jgi:transposase